MEILHDANITSGRVMQIMSEIYGGRKFTPFVTKDISNYRAKQSKGTKYHDMSDTLSYFAKMKKSDPNFYYKFDLDEHNRAKNLFWVDGPARAAYK